MPIKVFSLSIFLALAPLVTIDTISVLPSVLSLPNSRGSANCALTSLAVFFTTEKRISSKASCQENISPSASLASYLSTLSTVLFASELINLPSLLR